MNKYIIVLFLTIVTISQSYCQSYSYENNQNNNGLRIVESKSDLVKLSFGISEFELMDINVEDILMTKIIWGSAFLPGKEGYPELPSVTKNIVIPKDASLELETTFKSIEILPNIIVHPTAKTPGELQHTFEAQRGKIYIEDSFYPVSPIQISYTEIRGQRIARVSIIPFQYNPVTKELLIHKNLDFDLKIKSKNYKYADQRYRSIYWDQILADILFNYEDLPHVNYSNSNPRNQDGCDLLIICPNKESFIQWADTIKRFRNEQGINTRIVTIEEIGGNQPDIIKEYVSDVYNNWNLVPSAMLILADYGYDDNEILSPKYSDHPEFGDPYVGDNYYSDMNNNSLPDIILSRIPAKNDEELEIMVNKFITYEKSPPTANHYYKTPLLACGYQSNRWFQMCTESISGYMRQALGKEPVRIDELFSHPQSNPMTDPWSTAPNTELPNNYFGVTGLGYIPNAPKDCGPWGNGTAEDILAQLESGSFLSIFRDHGGSQGLGAPFFVSEHLTELENENFPTHLFSYACYNGSFNYPYNSFIEELMLHKNGGIISGIASSTWSWSFYNDCLLWGSIDNLWQGFLPDYGSSEIPFREFRPAFGLAAGKYYMYNSNWIESDIKKIVTNKIWHSFGDPFNIVYTAVPMVNSVEYENFLFNYSTRLEVYTEPLSLVCLSLNGEIIAKAFTNEDGKTNLEFNPVESGSKLKIVVTKQNYLRYDEFIYVIPENGPYLIVEEIKLVDQNNNGNVDYNETTQVKFRIKNFGNQASEIIKLHISGNEQYYQFTSEQNYVINELQPNQEIILNDLIEFKTDIYTPDQTKFFIEVNSDNEEVFANIRIPVLVNSPKFDFSMATFTEIIGNNDNNPNPGETLDVHVQYCNIGHASFPSSEFSIESTSSNIQIISTNFQIPEMDINDTVYLDYQILLSQNTDSNTIHKVIYYLDNETIPFTQDQYFITNLLIEDFETGDLNKFDWYFEGDKDWEIANDFPGEGEYSAKISDLETYQKASINLDYYFGLDFNLRFSMQFLSNKNDILNFYLNDSLIQTWSPVIFFGFDSNFCIPIPKGQNKLTWEFSKDSIVSGFHNAVWLDRIILPPIDSIPGLAFNNVENKKHLTISPNPTMGMVTVKNNLSSTIKMIEIIALDGQLIHQFTKNISPNSFSILNLSTLPKGCYIITMRSSNDEVFTDKLIIE